LQEGPIIYGAQRVDGGASGITQATPTCFLSFWKIFLEYLKKSLQKIIKIKKMFFILFGKKNHFQKN
jgi:hypothetical protein